MMVPSLKTTHFHIMCNTHTHVHRTLTNVVVCEPLPVVVLPVPWS
jgi:hypothetical protein